MTNMDIEHDLNSIFQESTIPLTLVGITYNQIESGVYALILRERDGGRRLPIIIGYPEAQAIECKLQNVRTPRPLTHDLMAQMLHTLQATVLCVIIRRFPNGVFGAFIDILDQSGKHNVMDARSSDAIALAIRLDVPILTSEKVLAEAGIPTDPSTSTRPTERPETELRIVSSDIVGDDKASLAENMDTDPDARRVERLSIMSLAALEKKLEEAIASDNFEYAALIKRAIDINKSRI